jgi:hypothetical protein
MAVVMLMKWPGVSKEDYDRVMEILDLDTTPPEGALFHVCGHDGDTLRILDIWESEPAWNTFLNGRLGAAVGEAGLPGQPDVKVYPVHNLYAPEMGEIERMGSRALAGA